MHGRYRMLVAMAVLGAAGVARAGPAPRTHDGFFLQLEGGFGALSSEADGLKMSGGGGVFGITLGGALTPNFVIGGQLWGMVVPDPDFEVNGVAVPSATDVSFGLSGIGLNLTYYFMPLNLYLSATPSIGTLSLESGGQTFETDSGFALRLAVGKEWFVSDNWGIGLNLQYAYGSNEDQGPNAPTWKTNWFGVAFSATYN